MTHDIKGQVPTCHMTKKGRISNRKSSNQKSRWFTSFSYQNKYYKHVLLEKRSCVKWEQNLKMEKTVEIYHIILISIWFKGCDSNFLGKYFSNFKSCYKWNIVTCISFQALS